MRVIAGSLGGRSFDSPGSLATHPMSDRVRGALFNVLGDIEGLSLLDAYAGSGALTYEAMSRGAASALAIDIDKKAYKTMCANVESLGLQDSVMVMHKNIASWSRNNQTLQFDIVIADPPYNDIWPNILQKLVKHVKTGGLFILSWPGNEPVRPFVGLTAVSHKKYGDAQLVFYRKNA